MNVKQMHTGVRLGVQKMASNEIDDLRPEEIDYYLNNNIAQYIKQQYSHIKNTERGEGHQFVHENLRKLLVTVKIINTNFNPSTILPKSKEANLPEDYNYYISSYSELNGERKTNIFIQPQVIHKYITTESNYPIFRQLPVYIEDNKITVIIEGDNLELDLFLTYIKTQPAIKHDPNGTHVEPDFLPDHTHKEIVDMTVREILKDLNQFSEVQQ